MRVFLESLRMSLEDDYDDLMAFCKAVEEETGDWPDHNTEERFYMVFLMELYEVLDV